MAIQYDWFAPETPLLVTDAFNEALFQQGYVDLISEVGTLMIIHVVVPATSFDDLPLVVFRYGNKMFAVPVAVAALCAPGWKQ